MSHNTHDETSLDVSEMSDDAGVQPSSATDAIDLVPTVSEVGLKTVQILWLHRRLMSYIALATSVVIVLAVIGTSIWGGAHVVENLSKFEAFLISAFMTLIGLVGAYMGLATMADVRAGGNRFK